jgi:hypothetical protein
MMICEYTSKIGADYSNLHAPRRAGATKSEDVSPDARGGSPGPAAGRLRELAVVSRHGIPQWSSPLQLDVDLTPEAGQLPVAHRQSPAAAQVACLRYTAAVSSNYVQSCLAGSRGIV